MSKQLIKTLLTVCQKKSEFIPHSKTMLGFCREYSIGEIQNTRIFFTVKDYTDIAMILKNEFGVDPQTRPDTWDGISRTEAMKFSNNEKMTSESVKEGLVYIKALSGKKLYVNQKEMDLPDGSHLAIPLQNLSIAHEHQSILLIENWLNFEGTHKTPLLDQIEGNPLVLYRGDKDISPASAKKLMEEAGLPVYAFVDYDPKGLIIANTLPYFADIITPPDDVLEEMISNAGNNDRFIAQKASLPMALDNLTHPKLKQIWKMIDEKANALPQESLIIS